MVELWRTDRQVRSMFDLANPLHRRDFALWLGREGGSLGLDSGSIAAALALQQRGTSLLRPPPRWRPQAAQTGLDTTVDVWLAEPIAWDLGVPPDCIPMP